MRDRCKSYTMIFIHGPLAQLVEQETLNLFVGGSTPSRSTISIIRLNPNWYRDLTVNQATVGSNPTKRAKFEVSAYSTINKPIYHHRVLVMTLQTSFGPLAQWKSNSFTRRRSAVQPCHGLPYWWLVGALKNGTTVRQYILGP